MCLRYSFGRVDDAKLVEAAVENVLNDGLRTGDIMQPGKKQVGTREMGDAVIAALNALNR
jgi:3-isopropylmalate dehydrogenase